MSNVLKGATAGVIFFAWVFSCAGVGANWNVGTVTNNLYKGKSVVSTSLWTQSTCTTNVASQVDACTSLNIDDGLEQAEKGVEAECSSILRDDDLSSEDCEDKAKEGLNKLKARLNTARAFGIMVALLGLPTLALSVMGIGKGIPGAILSFMCSLFCVIAVGVAQCSSEDQATDQNCVFSPFKTEETKTILYGTYTTHVAGGAGFALEILAFILFFIGAILAILVGRSQDASAEGGAKDTPGIHGLPTEEVKNPGNPTNAAGLNDEL